MAALVGKIEALLRYPVKSMRGEALDAAALGWHGLEGDRRLAFRRLEDRGDFPFLTATKLPSLLLFTPLGNGLVRTPEGTALSGEALDAEVSRRCGSPVQLMALKNGIFDDACISIISSATVREIARLSESPADLRRFRPNIVVTSMRGVPFEEDEWLGRSVSFGENDAAVSVVSRDVRCAMVNYDPDTAAASPEVMRAIVRARDNNAGVYATVTQIGQLHVGQSVLIK